MYCRIRTHGYGFAIPIASICYAPPLGFLYSKRFDIVIITDEKVKVSTKSVPFLSQFFLKKVSENSHGENTVLIRYAPQKITAQFVTHLSVMIEFSREM